MAHQQQHQQPIRRRTFVSLATSQLDLSLLAQEPAPAQDGSTPIPWWALFTLATVSVGGCILTACMWAGLIR